MKDGCTKLLIAASAWPVNLAMFGLASSVVALTCSVILELWLGRTPSLTAVLDVWGPILLPSHSTPDSGHNIAWFFHWMLIVLTARGIFGSVLRGLQGDGPRKRGVLLFPWLFYVLFSSIPYIAGFYLAMPFSVRMEGVRHIPEMVVGVASMSLWRWLARTALSLNKNQDPERGEGATTLAEVFYGKVTHRVR